MPGGLCLSLFGVFLFFTKKSRILLNEYKICLKMREMAILETYESMPPDPPRKLTPLVLVLPSLSECPGSTPD